jgi:hypothetical protein
MKNQNSDAVSDMLRQKLILKRPDFFLPRSYTEVTRSYTEFIIRIFLPCSSVISVVNIKMHTKRNYSASMIAIIKVNTGSKIAP